MKYIEEVQPESEFQDEEINLYARSVCELAEDISKFHYILVSGASRSIARVAIQAAGIDPKKIVSINSYLNNISYKRIRDQTYDHNFERRSREILAFLQNLGILPGTHKICMVDDHSTTGGKAIALTTLFCRIGFDFHYYSLASYRSLRQRNTVSQLMHTMSKSFENPLPYMEYEQRIHVPTVSIPVGSILALSEAVTAASHEVPYQDGDVNQHYKRKNIEASRLVQNSLRRIHAAVKGTSEL